MLPPSGNLESGPHDRHVVDAAVFEEVGVLRGQDGVDHRLRNVFEADRLTVALAQLAEQHAVGRVEL